MELVHLEKMVSSHSSCTCALCHSVDTGNRKILASLEEVHR
jgi:hypothetical protein